ncbi:MAG: hypothetical protein HQL68_06735 [Magnetococcales bacterium]|nr:hypothetical protein [Magnetococcales bacterium]
MVDNQQNIKKEISVVIDDSLLKHIHEKLKEQHTDDNPEDVITSFLEIILNNSDYPLAAKKTGEKEIKISYNLHSFSMPFFD